MKKKSNFFKKKIWKNKELREWLNIIIQMNVLIVMIIGLIQINQIKINLEEIKGEKADFFFIKANQTITENLSVARIKFPSGGKIQDAKFP